MLPKIPKLKFICVGLKLTYASVVLKYKAFFVHFIADQNKNFFQDITKKALVISAYLEYFLTSLNKFYYTVQMAKIRKKVRFRGAVVFQPPSLYGSKVEKKNTGWC